MRCRSCNAKVSLPFVDLGSAPPSNAFITPAQVGKPEPCFPLRAFVCEKCWLVQLDEVRAADELFTPEYAYYSSYSSTWLAHSAAYVEGMTARLALDRASFVVEVASNDGYLLQFFEQAGVPCLGIEPTAGTAAAARARGVETREVFWGRDQARLLVEDRGQADLLLGNNVLAHVPDLHDFVDGFRIALAARGTVTFEFPHLLNLIRLHQFDTIYHEHYSYLSLTFVCALLAAHDLTVYDVEELPTHGGSLRVFARHAANDSIAISAAVTAVEAQEIEAGLRLPAGYTGMQPAVDAIRTAALAFLDQQVAAGKRVAAYGAAAKANTFLNYCGVRGTGQIAYVVDKSPHKQGLLLPGSNIPIVSEQTLREDRPDFVVILPWNLRDEITQQLEYVREWGGRFVTCIPELTIT
jgi:hypothetical protein